MKRTGMSEKRRAVSGTFRVLPRGKRGFLFTTAALLIVLAIIFLSQGHEHVASRTLAQTARIHTMDGYLENLEQDLPRAAYIAAFRSLIGLEEHISTTNAYIADFDGSFTSIFINGTVNGTQYSIMDNSTFTDFTARFQQLAMTQGMNANLTVLAVNATQESPWEVTLNASVLIELGDSAGTASFNRTVNVAARIPIEGIKDPVYSIGTQGRAPHVFHESNVTPPYINPATNDTTRLQTLVNETMYIASPLAPSFLQRFQGNFSSSPWGIQSLVNNKELRAQGVPTDTCKSVVDYLYFGPVDTNPNRYIINMDQSDFWLDDAHLAEYDAVGAVVGDAPC